MSEPTVQYRIRLWNVGTGKEIGCLQGHDANVTSLAYSPDGTRLVSGFYDGTALIWDVKDAVKQRAKLRNDSGSN